MTIEHRRSVRAGRWTARQDAAGGWGETPESRQDNDVNGWKYLDIFNLRLLFGMESLFDEICELSIMRYEEERILEEERIQQLQRRLEEDREERLEVWQNLAPGG